MKISFLKEFKLTVRFLYTFMIAGETFLHRLYYITLEKGRVHSKLQPQHYQTLLLSHLTNLTSTYTTTTFTKNIL